MLAGILGDEAKLAFRTRPNGIARLSKDVISESDGYWNQFTTLFDSASDVYSLILPNDVRKAMQDAPENVANLIRAMCARLFELSASPSFPSSSSPSVAAFASSFIRTSSSTSINATKEVLNCIRVLQRVLPVVFEAEGGPSRFEMAVLWHRPSAIPVPLQAEDYGLVPQFVIEDDDEEHNIDLSQPTTPKLVASESSCGTSPSLAERLFSCLIDLMFCWYDSMETFVVLSLTCSFSGFTLQASSHGKISFAIWFVVFNLLTR
jgi:hypothetical protein